MQGLFQPFTLEVSGAYGFRKSCCHTRGSLVGTTRGTASETAAGRGGTLRGTEMYGSAWSLPSSKEGRGIFWLGWKFPTGWKGTTDHDIYGIAVL